MSCDIDMLTEIVEVEKARNLCAWTLVIERIIESAPYIDYHMMMLCCVDFYNHSMISNIHALSSSEAIESAMLSGNIKLIKFLRNECGLKIKFPSCVDYIYNIDVLKYMIEDVKIPWHPSILNNAAYMGNILILEYAVKNKYNGNKNFSYALFLHPHPSTKKLNIVRYCCENGIAGIKLMERAVSLSTIEIVTYLKGIGQQWSPLLCKYAILQPDEKDALEMLQYLHKNGCPWDSKTVNTSIEHGRFECLKYAVENGCAMTNESTLMATKHRRPDYLAYLIRNGCNVLPDVCITQTWLWLFAYHKKEPIEIAAATECLEILRQITNAPWTFESIEETDEEENIVESYPVIKESEW